MRKNIKFIGFLLLLIIGSGCSFQNWFGNQPKQPGINQSGSLGVARAYTGAFLAARLNGEAEDELKKLLSEEGWQDYREQSNIILLREFKPRLVGAKILKEKAQPGDKFLFQVSLQSAYYDQPYAENTEESLVVKYIRPRYLIDAAQFLVRTIVLERGDLLIRKRGSEETAILDLKALPNELSPQGAGPEIRFGFGKERFATLAISPDAKRVGFGTKGIHGGIGWINLSGTKPKVHPLDIIFEGAPSFMAISPNGRFMAVEYFSPTGNRGIRFYNLNRNSLVELNLTGKFRLDLYNLALLNWDYNKQVLVFRVDTGAGATEIESGNLGDWEINVETGQLKKILN